MLSKLGFIVEKAENGEEALERIKQNKPDLIVLDNIMPGLTGWEVTKKLKSDDEYAAYSDVPIIMFSAMDSEEDKIEGFELGVEDYITKPFNFSEVLARIRAVFRLRAGKSSPILVNSSAVFFMVLILLSIFSISISAPMVATYSFILRSLNLLPFTSYRGSDPKS